MSTLKHTINYTEYTIEYKIGEHGYDIEYKIYEPYNNDPNKLELIINGYVKWDGCSNWDFAGCRTCLWHACTRDGLQTLSLLPQFCWDHCSNNLKNFDKDEASD